MSSVFPSLAWPGKAWEIVKIYPLILSDLKQKWPSENTLKTSYVEKGLILLRFVKWNEIYVRSRINDLTPFERKIHNRNNVLTSKIITAANKQKDYKLTRAATLVQNLWPLLDRNKHLMTTPLTWVYFLETLNVLGGTGITSNNRTGLEPVIRTT